VPQQGEGRADGYRVCSPPNPPNSPITAALVWRFSYRRLCLARWESLTLEHRHGQQDAIHLSQVILLHYECVGIDEQSMGNMVVACAGAGGGLDNLCTYCILYTVYRLNMPHVAMELLSDKKMHRCTGRKPQKQAPTTKGTRKKIILFYSRRRRQMLSS
jgi:hypothetical protein